MVSQMERSSRLSKAEENPMQTMGSGSLLMPQAPHPFAENQLFEVNTSMGEEYEE